ncbi:hypothetical protein G7046_g699 [Stylonectria norvegica]|nr:hypothetical protein G7046_g699 [Stylonectria norvegica]
MTDVATRISLLEKTIIAVTNDHETLVPAGSLSSRNTTPLTTTINTPLHERTTQPPGSPSSFDHEQDDTSSSHGILLSKGSSSQYFNEVLLSHVIEQEHDLRSALATPTSESPGPPRTTQTFASPFNPMGILSAQCFARPVSSYHPRKLTAVNLWKYFVDYVDPHAKVLHMPTAEVILYTVVDDPARASPEDLALCFAIYYAATITLDPADIPSVLMNDERSECLHQFKNGLEQALAHADFLENPTVTSLQAVSIYLTGLRVYNSSRSIWTLNGLAIRAAQSVGLHRDGKRLGLSAFESEIRRRLWWSFLARDGRAAEDYGIQSTSNPALLSGVDLPLNLDDNDLYPEMTALPKPRAGWTRITLTLASIEIARAWGRISQLGWSSTEPPREEVRAEMVSQLNSRMNEMLQLCNPVIPQQMVTMEIARFIARKLDFVTRQQFRTINQPLNPESFSTEDTLLDAVRLLEDARKIWSNELLRPVGCSMRSFPQYHIMLYILWHLCAQPPGPNTDHALATVEYHIESVRTLDTRAIHGPKWSVLMALKDKAVARASHRGLQRTDRTGRNGTQLTPGASEPSGDFSTVPAVLGDSEMERFASTLPDWNTLLQDFQLDSTDYSVFL